MRFNLDIGSFNVNNATKDNPDFKKYDIDVSLNELTSAENSCQLKYGYTFSSSPKGIHFSLEGMIDVSGNPSEIESIYQKDEQNIPNILRLSYQELYPVLFMMTKSMKIPCPPYEISKTMGVSQETVDNPSETISESMESEIKPELIEAEPNLVDEEEPELNKFDIMSTAELTQLQIDLTNKNSENPSEELEKEIDAVSKILNKKINQSIDSTNVS